MIRLYLYYRFDNSVMQTQVFASNGSLLIEVMIPTVKPSRRRWTYELFLQRAKEIHGDRYDYSGLRREDMKGKETRFMIRCRSCSHEWSCTIHQHINGKTGCPSCAGCVKWTLQRFIDRAHAIHGNRYYYGEITEFHIQNKSSKVPLVCRICAYRWSPTIQNHIHRKSGCPNCVGKARWTMERFLDQARSTHGARYDYSMIAEDQINGYESKVNIRCTVCGYVWLISIGNHVRGVTGCPNCASVARWTLDRFLEAGKQVHGDAYDYSLISSNDITGAHDKVQVLCKGCKTVWMVSISNHINNARGCPRCCRSHGETICKSILTAFGIVTEEEYIIPGSTRRYDFMFEYQGKFYILEFDGIQHFRYTNFFHETYEIFLERQRIDVEKSYFAIMKGYYLIRIDYTAIDNIMEHVASALSLLGGDRRCYFSTNELYRYITTILYPE